MDLAVRLRRLQQHTAPLGATKSVKVMINNDVLLSFCVYESSFPCPSGKQKQNLFCSKARNLFDQSSCFDIDSLRDF